MRPGVRPGRSRRDLSHGLLDVSLVAHGRLRLRRERIDLREVVGNAIETLESDIKQRNHSLTTSLPDSPVWLQADSGRLDWSQGRAPDSAAEASSPFACLESTRQPCSTRHDPSTSGMIFPISMAWLAGTSLTPMTI